jgi:peptide/nickel transport system permease protein
MKLGPLAPLAVLLLAGLLGAPAATAGWPALLGHDEFGRDHLVVLVVATGRSVGFGLLLTTISLALAVGVAAALAGRRHGITRAAVGAAARVLESIPLMLWVLAAFAAVRQAPALISAGAFIFAVVPPLAIVVAGELERLDRAQYVEAARLLGVRRGVILFRHLIPNAAGVLAPLAVQVLGMAIAIRGAVGLLGFGRRTDFDLGVVLLRGRERLALDPGIIFSAVVAFILVYGYLAWLSRFARRRAPAGAAAEIGYIPA